MGGKRKYGRRGRGGLIMASTNRPNIAKSVAAGSGSAAENLLDTAKLSAVRAKWDAWGSITYRLSRPSGRFLKAISRGEPFILSLRSMGEAEAENLVTCLSSEYPGIEFSYDAGAFPELGYRFLKIRVIG